MHKEKKTSQFGEAEIIDDLIERFDIPETCIEFGAYDGVTNSNTYHLWHDKNFRGLLIEPDTASVKALEDLIADFPEVSLINDFVTLEKPVSHHMAQVAFPKEVGVLSIDIDSNDLEIFESVDHQHTHVVIIEFNQQLPATIDYRDPVGTVFFRHSAAATARVAKELGYGVVACIGCNLVLLNGRHHPLEEEWLEPDLAKIFDYREHKRACGDVRIVGCKFTTNAKAFTVPPTTYLRAKAWIKKASLARNYRRRNKTVPSDTISEDCKQALLKAGLYV